MTSFLKADRSRPVAVWLLLTAALVVAMVVIGGATRMTDSGLSITQWRPITGAIPPLSEADWMREFDLYKRIPQFAQMNPDMTLAGFKYIFWWEWTHRLLGRLLGFVFAVPFVWFIVTRQIPKRLVGPCIGLFVLGGVQGLVGWWMVSSGLSARVSVAPERLAAHLGLALILYVALILCALEAANGVGRVNDKGPWAKGGALLAGLIFLQILLGALVAGTRAGRINTDWPMMSGRFLPSDYLGKDVWDTVAHNPASVQFDHRMMGYLTLLLILAFAVTARSSRLVQPQVRSGAFILAFLGSAQVALGIVTLMLAAPLWMGMIHQLAAVALLTCAVMVSWRATRL